MIHDEYIIMCPSLLLYPEPPKDQPGCELDNCPYCNKKMWISKKKRALREALAKKPLIVACYDCLTEMVAKGKLSHGTVRALNI